MFSSSEVAGHVAGVASCALDGKYPAPNIVGTATSNAKLKTTGERITSPPQDEPVDRLGSTSHITRRVGSVKSITPRQWSIVLTCLIRPGHARQCVAPGAVPDVFRH